MTRDDVIAEARKWVGVPYRKKGRDRNGLDCIGLLIVVGQAFGISSPYAENLDYSDRPAQDHLILRHLETQIIPLPPSTPKPGLIGCFAERRLPGHTGIFTLKHGAVHVIHARMRPAKVIEEAWEQIPRGEMRLIALFGLPGLEL